MDTYNNFHYFCDWALQSRSPHWDTQYWCIGFARIAFFSIISLMIKIHPRNESIFDAHNNHHSFCYKHYNYVLNIGIHDIATLDLQEKLSFHIFLIINIFYEKRQTWVLVIIAILFVMGTIIMFPKLGYMILVLWICKKAFPSTIFLIINVRLWNKTNLDTFNNLHYFCDWAL